MKAILVVDMPKSCADCKLADFGRCWGTYSYVHMRSDDIPVNCPLKPMPMKRISTVDWLHTETQTQSATSTGKYPCDYTQIKTYEPSEYDKGWNDCLDILEDLYD